MGYIDTGRRLNMVDDKRERAWQIVLDSLGEYDSTEEAVEDFYQYFLNSEWPDDECSGAVTEENDGTRILR
jgi:hypothetical protein